MQCSADAAWPDDRNRERADFADYTNADRVGGLAGLVSALCRFEEYQGCTTAIRNAADRILKLKAFTYRGRILWKTMPGIPRAISGAGHGASGIAEALFSASRILGDEKYLPAAEDALGYELDAYRRYAGKFGTWADLRDFPPLQYMHGYCSGAPGTGIMLDRIIRQGHGCQTARILASLAHESMEKLPLKPLRPPMLRELGDCGVLSFHRGLKGSRKGPRRHVRAQAARR